MNGRHSLDRLQLDDQISVDEQVDAECNFGVDVFITYVDVLLTFHVQSLSNQFLCEDG